MSDRAKLRVCASCEWIFRAEKETFQGILEAWEGCPKCGFSTYPARSVYGDRVYRYAKTQKPWLDKKVMEYTLKLLKETRESQQPIKPFEALMKDFEQEENSCRKELPPIGGKRGKGIYETGTVGKLPY